MSELSSKNAFPAKAAFRRLSRAEAAALCAELHADWSSRPTPRACKRAYKFKDFYRTMSFVNAVAHIANVEDHHPDLEVGYDYCRVTYTTHSIRGLSQNDFICAAKIDRLSD